MINVLDPQAEKRRQNKLIDTTATTIKNAMVREFRRLAKVASIHYIERQDVPSTIMPEHEQRVHSILKNSTDRLMLRYFKDATKSVPKTKGWQDYCRKAVQDEFPREDEQSDDELLAALLLLLLTRFQASWESERIIPVAQTITNTSWRDIQAAQAMARQQEADAFSNAAAGAVAGTSVSIDAGRIRRDAAAAMSQSIIKAGNARAGTIGQTEAGTVASVAADTAVNGMISGLNGIMANKSWVSRQDDRVRNFSDGDFSHVSANGQQVSTTLPFQIPRKGGGTEALRFPRDPNGSAGNVINCRCIAVYEIDEGI